MLGRCSRVSRRDLSLFFFIQVHVSKHVSAPSSSSLLPRVSFLLSFLRSVRTSVPPYFSLFAASRRCGGGCFLRASIHPQPQQREERAENIYIITVHVVGRVFGSDETGAAARPFSVACQTATSHFYFSTTAVFFLFWRILCRRQLFCEEQNNRDRGGGGGWQRLYCIIFAPENVPNDSATSTLCCFWFFFGQILFIAAAATTHGCCR